MTKKVATSKNNNALAIAKPTQNDIPALLEQVNAQIASLKGDAPDKETTSGTSLSGFGAIKQINKVEDLVKAHSMLTAKEAAYNNSAKELDVNTKKFPFKQDGHTVDAWKEDIRSRMAVVKNETELKKLEEVKKLLEDNLSQEAKLQKDLQKAQQIMLDGIS